MVTSARPSDIRHHYFVRVLGIAYQALGDAALATEAAEACFKRLARRREIDSDMLWRTLVQVLQRYIQRGINVALLHSEATGWQAALLDQLATLPPYERIVLLLYYHEQLNIDRLAVIMDDDVASIRETVEQARQQIVGKMGLTDALR